MRAVLLSWIGVLLMFTLLVLFFTKRNVDNEETRIYKSLLVYSTIFNIVGILTFLVAKLTNNLAAIAIYQKVYLSFMIIINFYAVKYCIVLITTKEKAKKINQLLFYVTVISIIGVILTPLTAIFYDDVLDGTGLSYDIAIYYTVASLLFFLIETIYMIITKKFVIKIVPFITLTVLYIVGLVLRNIYPELTFEGFFYAYILLVMYHTIENPDLKMLEEYTKNKELTENSIEDRSNLLFKISEDVKTPIRKIKEYSDSILNTNNLKVKDDIALDISNESTNLLNNVNEVLNISYLDKKNIKVFDTSYNIYNLYSELIYIIKGKINDNIDFKYSISDSIPDKLNGDSSKLKQIIVSLLLDNIKKKSKGIIDLDINAIVKYDICRLVITMRSSINKMSLIDINNVLSSNVEIDEEKVKEFESMNIDILLVKKIIDVLDGTLLIYTDDKCTTFKVIINQMVLNDNIDRELESISKKLSNKKKVLLVDDDYKKLNKISIALKESNYNVVSVMFADEIIKKLTLDKTFDLLLIDDEMKNGNAVDYIQKIDDLKLNNLKKIIMLEKDKESIKDYYLKDYPFDDYLLKEDLNEEIKRINNKY